MGCRLVGIGRLLCLCAFMCIAGVVQKNLAAANISMCGDLATEALFFIL